MWIFLAEHQWWGLVYLLTVCVTAFFCSMAMGAAMGARRKVQFEEHAGRRAKSDKDMVH